MMAQPLPLHQRRAARKHFLAALEDILDAARFAHVMGRVLDMLTPEERLAISPALPAAPASAIVSVSNPFASCAVQVLDADCWRAVADQVGSGDKLCFALACRTWRRAAASIALRQC